VKRIIKRALRKLGLRSRDGRIPWGEIDFGELRQLKPISNIYGWDRGAPVDRYYIEKFLEQYKAAIGGHVMEIGEDVYTRRFGGSRVSKSDVLHVVEGNPQATIVGDISHAPEIASNTFDCIVLTQTLQFIFNLSGVVDTVHRILKPGGCALFTVSGISHISHHDPLESWDDYWCWHFTQLVLHKLFGVVFPAANVTTTGYGNVLAAISFLHGIASSELTQAELDHRDPDYDLVIGLKVTKPHRL